MKKVSIVLPTYNRGEMLKKAIESCLNQTYKNLELIIVNDGSNDETENIVMDFQNKDSRIKYISTKNRGLPAALNTGFRNSVGEYLTWTSDDNIYYPNAIERMVEVLQKQNSPTLVYAEMDFYIEDKNELKHYNKGVTFRPYLECTIGACFLYSREIYEKIGDYSEDLRFVEDYDYWIRIYEKFNILFLNEILYRYNLHSETLTIQKKAEVKLALEKLRKKHNCYYKVANEIKNQSKDRDIYLWGSGEYANLFFNEIINKYNIKITGVIDTYKTGYFQNFSIYSPKILKNKEFKPYVIIASSFRSEIEKILKDYGYEADKDYY